MLAVSSPIRAISCRHDWQHFTASFAVVYLNGSCTVAIPLNGHVRFLTLGLVDLGGLGRDAYAHRLGDGLARYIPVS